jgi:thiaminase
MTHESILSAFSSEIDKVINSEHLNKLSSLDTEQFKLWLTQEYIFLQSLLRLLGSGLSKATTITGLKTFSHGIKFIKEEMDFLESKMVEVKVKPTEVHTYKEVQQYSEFLTYLMSSDYKTIALTVWMICFFYNQTLDKNKVSNIASDLVQRWKGLDFVEFLELLRKEIDTSLKSGSDSSFENNFKGIFDKLKDLEINSWKMLLQPEQKK